MGCTSLTSVTFQGVITSANFSDKASFPGDLRDKYLAGGIGTYTRPNGSSEVWAKQSVAANAQQYDPESDFEVSPLRVRGDTELCITKYVGSKQTVSIPPTIKGSPVVAIGPEAFQKNLTSVTIPNSVIVISDGAFYGCTSLTSVTIPNSVTSIGERAFSYCASLASITIPNSVTIIEDDAFDGTSLNSVTFLGTIPNVNLNFGLLSFPGDLRSKFYETDKTNGTPGRYTRTGYGYAWTKQ